MAKSESTPLWDILIHDALVFDGSGEVPQALDVAIKGGKIAAIGEDLKGGGAKQLIDGSHKWLMPGLLDIHSHFDLEVEVAPELPEAVRHGTTTVINSNCSLGVAFGKQTNKDRPEENPILDCFARVENIPKSVLSKCIDTAVTWDNTGDYIKHFDHLNLGPNVAVMVPHTMLRIEVMGLEESISREPTDDEIQRMCQFTQKAFDQGFVGFSSDGLPLHYLANDPHCNEKIPAQHATIREIRALGEVTRKNDRIWQCTPDPDNMLRTAVMFFMTSGRLFKKTLKMTATAAMDLNSNKRAAEGLLRLSKLLNSNLLKGNFTFQALSCPFRVYADGVTTPLLEEKPAFRELNAIEIENVAGRKKLLNDPAFIERFREDWMRGKKGFNLARLQRLLSIEPTTFSRDLNHIEIVSCPNEIWDGHNAGEVYRRLLNYQATNGTRGALSEKEAEEFAKFPSPIQDDADFVLHLLREFDRKFRWYTITANTRPEILKKLLFHEQTLPGFNDSGAHLTNMAYYDGNLLTLKMAAEESIDWVSQAVKRLTRDPARLFDIDVGSIAIGAQADVVLIDPDALLRYDSLAHTKMHYRDLFDHDQMVNRSDGVVDKVVIAGEVVWSGKKYVKSFGKKRFGRLLKSNQVLCNLQQVAEKLQPLSAVG